MLNRVLTAGAAALAALLMLALPLGASAKPKGKGKQKAAKKAKQKRPKLASAAAVDGDGDGRVDGVTVRFNRKVKGSAPAGAFRVSGMTVTGVGKARGKRVVLTVAEGTSCDLGAAPRVAYRAGKKGLKDRRGRKLRRSKVDMGRRDKLPPRITCAVTADRDGDGRIDALELTYSKPVQSAAQASGPFPFSVDGYSLRELGTARDRFMTLRLAEHNAADTAARPAVTYTPSSGPGVRGRGGQAFPGTFTATRDEAAPALVAARTRDTDTDGLVDAVFATFSEPVKADDSALVVEGGLLTAVARSGNDLTMAIAEGPFGTDARPTVSYPSGAVSDQAGNVAGAGSLTAEDGAAPLVERAFTEDLNGDGRLDWITVGFTEDVRHTADADGVYPLEVPGYPLSQTSEAGGSFVGLSLQQSSGPDTGSKPSVRYTRGAGSPVTDAAGNEAASTTFGATTDQAAPRLVGGTTADGDEDGSLDRLQLTWSEPVQHAQEAGPGAFSLSAVTATQALAASGTHIDLLVQETGSANTGVRPLITYAPDGSNDVQDAAGNLAPGASGVQSGDGAGAVVVTATTGDTDADQKLDRVDVTMSEPVTYPGDGTAPFDLGAAGYTVTSVGAAAGSGFSLNLAELGPPDTGGAPEISYSGGGLLEDASGIEAVERSYPGRTRDTLAPTFVAAETADVDGNGQIDRVDLRYSEDVQGGSNAAPFNVTGRNVTGIEFSTDRARIVVEESGTPDTADRPFAGYTTPPAPADRVRDIPEGNGDTAEEAPGQSTVQADDRALPAVIEAKTEDTGSPPDGRVDRVSVKFSEPVSHTAESEGPYAIHLSGHPISAVSAASGDSLTVDVVPALLPDGGSRPTVTVSEPAEVTDVAGNGAFGGAFGQTQDGVRPVLASAQLGERNGSGSCVQDPPENGSVDCLIVAWSEPVTHADDPSLVLGGGLTVSGTIPGQTEQPQTEMDLVESGSPDRTRSGSVSYTEGAAVPVVDAAGNESLSTNPSVFTGSACLDDLNEPNDSQLADNPVGGDLFPAVLCSLDEDWFRLMPDQNDELHLQMNPVLGMEVQYEVWSSTGLLPGGTASSDGSGAPVPLHLTGPLTDQYYWLRIVGSSATEEGQYCFDTVFESGDQPCTGQGGDPI